MNASEFAAKVRSKYPGSYDDLDDNTLTQKVLAKYPEYNDMVDQEAPGALKSGALGLMSGVPGAETAISAGEAALTPKTYEQAHQELEQAKDQAWESHPVAYGAGKATGIVGTGLALPATATLGGAAALGAGLGAASGLDVANKPSEMIKSAAEGAGTSAVLGSVGHGVGKLLEGTPTLAKNALAGLTNKGTPADIERYLANPEAINLAGSKEDIANKVASLTGDVTKASGQLSQEARGALNPQNAVDIKDLKNTAMDAVSKYYTEGNPATAADESAIKTIVDQYQRLATIAEGNDGKIPEPTLRSMIDRMQSATKENTFGNPEASTTQTALKEFSGKLNDLLRETNPSYAEKMAPSAEAAKLSSNLQDQFSLEGNQPTNATAGKIGNLLKEGKPETQDLASQLQNLTGTDIKNMTQNVQTKENLNEPGAGGLLKTAMATLGFGVGKMTGVPFGGIAGAAGGRFAGGAMNGGSIAKNIMNMYLAGQRSWPGEIASTVSKYGPILINAAKVGGNQLAATHFVLATSDPEYQKLVEHSQDNIPEGQ